jgi:hypothetical protein
VRSGDTGGWPGGGGSPGKAGSQVRPGNTEGVAGAQVGS